MRSLTVVATADCNLQCEYCYMPQRRDRQGDWGAVRRALERLLQRAADGVSITITGGEPVRAFDRVREVVTVAEAAMAGRAIRWNLLTNGLLLDEPILSYLDERGFTIRVSFDGVPAAQMLRGRGTFTRLDVLLDHVAVGHARLFRDRLQITMVLSPTTIATLDASVEYFLSKRVKHFAIAPAMGQPGWRPERIADLDAAFERVSVAALRHYRATAEVPLTLYRKTAAQENIERREWRCGAYSPEALTIDINGHAYGCLLASASYQGSGAQLRAPAVSALHVGDPDDPDFDRRLEALPRAAHECGAFEHAERRYSSYRRCADCEYLGRCRVCPLAESHRTPTADSGRIPDFLCAFSQVALAHRDRFPMQPSDMELLTGMVPLPSLDS